MTPLGALRSGDELGADELAPLPLPIIVCLLVFVHGCVEARVLFVSAVNVRLCSALLRLT